MRGWPWPLLLSLFLGTAVLSWVSHASLQSAVPTVIDNKRGKAESVPGEILVRFRKEAASAKVARSQMAVTESGRQIPIQLEQLSSAGIVEGLRLAHVAPEDTAAAIKALNARSDVLYAEPNFIRRALRTPNDPGYPSMWNLKNTGQPGPDNVPGKIGADIHAEQAWEITTGSRSIVVGVVDSGIDINHPDLKDNIWKNVTDIPDNGLDDDHNGFIDDVNGWDFVHNDNTVFDYALATYPPPDDYAYDIEDHGTHVAGIIGASGNNGVGVVGVNWEVSILPLKFLGPQGGSSADLLKAFAYVKMMRDLWVSSGGVHGANIKVLNNSYGGGGFSQAERDAIRTLSDSGILFVVAAGNDGQSNDQFPTYPANYTSPNLISVAASRRQDFPAGFSNYSTASINMSAPGEDILSTLPRDNYDVFSGTSMAAPHVSAGAALLCAVNSGVSMRRLRSALIYSGYPIVTPLVGSPFTNSGRNLDVYSALQNLSSQDVTPPAAVGQFALNSQPFLTPHLHWKAPGDDGNAGKAAAYEVRFSETNLLDPAVFELARPLLSPLPAMAGASQEQEVRIPWRHPSGFIGIRAIDEAGNASPISSLPYSVKAALADPYLVSETDGAPVSTGGTPLGLVGDDLYKVADLPFAFPAFNTAYSYVVASTNGALYIGRINAPPDNLSSVSQLSGYFMIAPAWDDLRTDRRAGDDIYVVPADASHPDRIIFRWQAVTYDYLLSPGVMRGENPVSFEVELRRDGTIQMRYGAGNERLFPVVGLSAGWPDPYVVDSHTSETALKNLTNAPSVTFTLKPQQITISGHVYDQDNLPLSGVEMKLISGVVITQATTADGSYSFAGRPPFQSGVLIASKTGYDFSPLTYDLGFPSDDVTVDFHARTRFTVLGRVTDANGTGIPSATITLTADGQFWFSLLTDPNGNYVIGNYFSPGTLTISPSKTNWSFNPTSQTLNAPRGSSTINFTALPVNQIDDPRAFVQQHYRDFLGREPDQGGWDYWTSQITQCGVEAACIQRKRLDVSAAFFIELEFQETGYVVYRMYRAAYGSMPGSPNRANIFSPQFNADRALLVGGSGLPQSTIDLASTLVARSAFRIEYPDAQSNADFVNHLFDKANLTGSANATLRQAEINLMTSGRTRAQVLLDVIDLQEFKDREYKPAFVLMQYFGYLRRDADQGGYDFWLNILDNNLPTDPRGYRSMVCAFVTSGEYQLRFGSQITHTNQECQ